MGTLHVEPTTRWISTLLLLLASAAPVCADETFLFRVSGGGFHLFDAWECPQQFCTVGGTPFTWEGTVSVVVDSAASGTYAPPHFVSMTMAWTTPYVPTVDRDLGTMSGPIPTVTLADGRVTSIDLIPIFGTPDTLTFSGLSVTYDKPPTHHFGPTQARAVLIPIPEPTSAVLLATGLIALPLVAVARRARPGRHGSSTIGACTSTSSTCASSSTSPTPAA
jgi:hypothetical protein